MEINTYTGVGSRNISTAERELILGVAAYLSERGYTCRSGKAAGADEAFAIGAVGAGYHRLVNYVPWKGFRNLEMGGDFYDRLLDDFNYDMCYTLAEKIHPAWHRCSPAARRLHARNILQVLGDDCSTPSLFLLACSDEDLLGDVKGGTRTAWMCAKEHNVPVFNIRGRTKKELWAFIKEIIG